MEITIKKIIILNIKIYKAAISPLLSKRCRFYPSCSDYFIKALEKKGLFRGCVTGVYRIIRCNPFNPGGYDPVR